MVPRLLPESFRDSPAYKIREQPWFVVRAEPAERGEMIRQRTLTLSMIPVGSLREVPPGEWTYPIPTIADSDPAMLDRYPSRDAFRLPFEAWRQTEWVSDTMIDAIISTQAEIRDVIRRIGVENAIRQIVVRDRVRQPLEGVNLTLSSLTDRLAQLKLDARVVELAVRQDLVDAGFAISIMDDCHLYGVHREGRISVLGLHAGPEFDLTIFAALIPNALLVDWLIPAVF